MINRFLLFMKMFLKGVFEFVVGVVGYLAVIIVVIVVAELIANFKIFPILFLIFLTGVAGLALFITADEFWDRYKRERDSRGL